MTNKPILSELIDLARQFNLAAAQKALADPVLSARVGQAQQERKDRQSALIKKVFANLSDISIQCRDEDEAEIRLVREVDPDILSLYELLAQSFACAAGLEAHTVIPDTDRRQEVSDAFSSYGHNTLAHLFAPKIQDHAPQ